MSTKVKTQSKAPPPSSRNRILVIIAVIIILIPLGYSFVAPLFALATGSTQEFLEKPDPKYENCVEDTTYMRFHHWELLRDIREEVVRYGVRGEVGLSKCRECHTSRERFCNQCHNAVSLYPDCFECHYYP